MNAVVTQKKEVIIKPNKYSYLRRFKFNRPINDSHVEVMKQSVIKYTAFRDVIVVKYKDTYLIVDGQHLAYALMSLKQDIKCAIYEFETDNDITDFMIAINNTSKSWKMEDYINAWADSNNKDYKILRGAIFENNIQATVAMQAYTQQNRAKATKMVKDGTFTIVNKAYGDTLISNVCDCTLLLPNTRQIGEALIKLMLNTEGYNNNLMLRNIRKVIKTYIFSTKEGVLYKQLLDIYNS